MKKIVLTDRSRMTTFAQCPRKAFWNYYWGGTGIVPQQEALPLLFGTAVHITLERLLVGGTSLVDAIHSGVAAFGSLDLPLRQEQSWLFECLIRIWAASRLPVLRAEFDFIAVEREILWTLGETDEKIILQMIRPDLLARRVSDGELFYIEWKTTGYGEEEWAKKWEKNTQVFCNALAIEETLREKVSGVMIEGLVKGPYKQEWRVSSKYRGKIIQQSPLCYGWRQTDGSLSTKWSYGAEHIALWEVSGMTPAGVVAASDHSQFLCPVPPICPSPEDLEDWREGAKYSMLRIDEGLELLAAASGSDKRKVVSRYFPPNFEACYEWRRKCEYFEPCFNPGVRKAPLENGFQLRTPHHEAEIPK
jgi:hypothetical protein